MTENREHVVAVRLNDYEYQKIKRLCTRENVRTSEGIRIALKGSSTLNGIANQSEES